MTIVRDRESAREPDLAVRIGSLTLKNPVLTASGTFGYALEYDDFFDVAELGGICTKGLSLEPRPGNPPNRICETAAGMLNAIGLANVGVEAFCRDKLPILRRREEARLALGGRDLHQHRAGVGIAAPRDRGESAADLRAPHQGLRPDPGLQFFDRHGKP